MGCFDDVMHNIWFLEDWLRSVLSYRLDSLEIDDDDHDSMSVICRQTQHCP